MNTAQRREISEIAFGNIFRRCRPWPVTNYHGDHLYDLGLELLAQRLGRHERTRRHLRPTLLEVGEDLGEALDNLTDAGAFDSMNDDRRSTKWEIGLRYRPVGRQLAFQMPVEQDMVALPEQSSFERMVGEYRTMGLYPRGHLMAKLRPALPRYLIRSDQVAQLPDGTDVWVAGIVIRRQMPLAKAVFMTLEDEFGHAPLVIWPAEWQRLKRVARAPVLMAFGTVSHREGTINVVVKDLRPIESGTPTLKTKDWV